MTTLINLGVRVEKTGDTYRLTDHVGGVHEAVRLNDGPTHAIRTIKEGRFPTFTRKCRLTEKNGVLYILGR